MDENKQEAEKQTDVNAVVSASEVGTVVDGANANQNEEQQQTSETQTETKTEPEKRAGLMKFIGNIIRRKPDDGKGQNADADAGTGTEVGEAVPVEFSDAATKVGMSPQQIEDFSSDYTNEELLKQVPLLLAQHSENSDKSEQLSQKESGVVQEQQQEAAATEKKVEESETEKDVEIKLLRERLDKVEASQQKSSKRSQEDALVSMASRATKRMDELSKKFEVFGTYDKLPRWPHNNQIIPNSPAAIARNKVWGLAYDLTTKAGIPFDNALNISVNAYKGENLAKDVERNLVRDLKANEKRLTAKHTSHESVKTNMTGVDIIRSVGKKHGVDIR